MSLGQYPFLDAVTDFAGAVRAEDGSGSEQAHRRMLAAFPDAAPDELAAAAPELAALLSALPPGPRANIAVVVGACVERGADPLPCAGPVFETFATALDDALDFVDQWTEAAGEEDLPDNETQPDPALLARFGHRTTLAWFTLSDWERAALALLQHPDVRANFDGRERLRELHEELIETADWWSKGLEYALLVLDDEPLIALHRESGTGYRFRMSGLADNFQLHTLLADALIGGGHLPGEPPSAEAAAVCRDAPGQVSTRGSFNLVAPSGEWIWNEGTPSDIPVLDGTRLLVLDPEPYQRSWRGGRYFPEMVGELTLEGVLPAEESARWFAHVAPAKGPTEQ
ncbi:hypothetical protein D5S18_10525 [Nocardia panacis]|uniref:Uncharacterized protein n=1 Tax=Nocardia panacis TaxID=2340916 RepID=A0A3A4KT67_9NOCA|nr:hypothetical protein [Nocardia panacis]RJO76696.1 hypothetical protein D5S18_10525 [Nocardia panacis]